MPRKNKMSHGQSLRWKRSTDVPCATSEAAECSGPLSSGEVKVCPVSHAISVQQGGQHHASCEPDFLC